jgi:hypothetical protein
MSNWKMEAKNMIAQADLGGCINMLEAKGVDCKNLLPDVAKLEAQRQKHVEEKTFMTSKEVDNRLEEFSRIGRLLIEKINLAAN